MHFKYKKVFFDLQPCLKTMINIIVKKYILLFVLAGCSHNGVEYKPGETLRKHCKMCNCYGGYEFCIDSCMVYMHILYSILSKYKIIYVLKRNKWDRYQNVCTCSRCLV